MHLLLLRKVFGAALLTLILALPSLRFAAAGAAAASGQERGRKWGRGRWNASGQWNRVGENYPEDRLFASAVARLLSDERPSGVLDVGTGSGYIARVVAEEAGLSVLGVDGNPAASTQPEVFSSGGSFAYQRLDVHMPFPSDFPRFDWVTSFAVAEHVPFYYEHLFLGNLERAARHGILLAWDERGSTGTGHVNCRDEPEVLRIFDFLGFSLDESLTTALRAQATLRWYGLALVLRRRPLVAAEASAMASASPRPGGPGAGECWGGAEKMEQCWHAGIRWLKSIAELAWREHDKACWPPPWRSMREQCCRRGGVWVPQVDEDRKTQCFGDGFHLEVCCASVDKYYMHWTPTARGIS